MSALPPKQTLEPDREKSRFAPKVDVLRLTKENPTYYPRNSQKLSNYFAVARNSAPKQKATGD